MSRRLPLLAIYSGHCYWNLHSTQLTDYYSLNQDTFQPITVEFQAVLIH